jgi:uncharacterized protein DUF4157
LLIVGPREQRGVSGREFQLSVDAFEQRREHERDQRREQPPAALPDDLTAAQRVASSVGNEAFGRIAQEGAGILPDGRAHPDVEDVIARTRGGGSELDAAARDRFGPALGDSLDDVRIHTDETADALSRSVSARAFATGRDVYFARGEYEPGSSGSDRLVAHELTHVAQQRGAPSSGPLAVSQPGDPLESEADNTADDLLR